ncbi:CRISPR-associated endonuclease Cas2 [uncultured Ilyobacter sp.]|uniref:CRISPR-associated endonuclease Cas2 n=1 Tax=uncultured Ilyobacter sp. TaxID=544433 RepID=UPI0029F5B86F|nr:CRISPR-associated endonuclease Cas2 [uncultured Ilyobacter sp.]
MYKFMRIIVFFDLPTTNKRDRKNYTTFRKFLLNDGYHMLQYSVYSRICNGYDSVKKHIKKLNKNLPPNGSIRVLTLTEKQYVGMELLVSKETSPEENLGTNKTIII